MGILLHNPGVSFFFDTCNFIVTHEDLLILLVLIHLHVVITLVM